MDVGELLLGVGRFVLATTLLLILTVPTAFIVIQMELKIIAQLQLRYGPNRVGPRGMFQSTIHGFKVLARDTTPDQADQSTFTMAPWMVFMAAAMSMLVIPFAPGLVAIDSSISVVYFFAVLGLSVVGLLVAGWASYNKYSLLGGLRSAAQMVSYEIPLTLSMVGIVVLAGSLSFTEIVGGSGSTAGASSGSSGLPIFFIAATAEIAPRSTWSRPTRRSWPAATEYSGMRFGFFFFAEYVALFIMSTIVVTLFFGGWLPPALPAAGRDHRDRAGRHLLLRQDLLLRVRGGLDAGHPAARARRPAHGRGLEVAAAAGAGEPVRDRHRRAGLQPEPVVGV